MPKDLETLRTLMVIAQANGFTKDLLKIKAEIKLEVDRVERKQRTKDSPRPSERIE